MKRLFNIPLGRLKETIASLEEPELWGMKVAYGSFSDYTLQRWTNRKALARTIRMQQKREHQQDDWKPVIPLSETEGF